MRPILFTLNSVNQMLPSGPTAMPKVGSLGGDRKLRDDLATGDAGQARTDEG